MSGPLRCGPVFAFFDGAVTRVLALWRLSFQREIP